MGSEMCIRDRLLIIIRVIIHTPKKREKRTDISKIKINPIHLHNQNPPNSRPFISLSGSPQDTEAPPLLSLRRKPASFWPFVTGRGSPVADHPQSAHRRSLPRLLDPPLSRDPTSVPLFFFRRACCPPPPGVLSVTREPPTATNHHHHTSLLLVQASKPSWKVKP